MRLTRIAIALSAMLFLSACSGTWQGLKADTQDKGNWIDGKPSTMGDAWGAFPTGYTGQNLGKPVIHPPAPETAAAAPAPQDWNQVNNFDQTGMPAQNNGPTNINDAVTVYPVDGAAPYSASNMPADQDYGQLVQELYFGYGSAAVSASDAKKLASFGKGVAKGKDGTVHLTVVGHSSKKVKGVKDPVRRKEINFEMAQKRANAVTRVLKKSGVNPAWVEAVSKGDEESNPNPGNKSQDAADQRVDLYMK